jgi:hypothetical protein
LGERYSCVHGLRRSSPTYRNHSHLLIHRSYHIPICMLRTAVTSSVALNLIMQCSFFINLWLYCEISRLVLQISPPCRVNSFHTTGQYAAAFRQAISTIANNRHLPICQHSLNQYILSQHEQLPGQVLCVFGDTSFRKDDQCQPIQCLPRLHTPNVPESPRLRRRLSAQTGQAYT